MGYVRPSSIVVLVGTSSLVLTLPVNLVVLARVAANHNAIISNVGIEPVSYRYYNKQTIALDFDGYLEDLQNAPERSVILVHGCAHNPTVSTAPAPRL